MADSWEEYDGDASRAPPVSAPPPGLGLSPSARPFAFNPQASNFTPSWLPISAPAPAPAPFVPAPPPQHSPATVISPVPIPAQVTRLLHAEPTVSFQQNGTPAAQHTSQPEQVSEETPVECTDGVAEVTEGVADMHVDAVQPAMETMDAEVEEPLTDVEAERQAILEALAKEDPREHLNIVFIGHVDAGKSTTGGQILFLTGGVDERTIEKYEREAKEKNRESWYMAYIMDTNEEERAKGKTVEVGRAHFETLKKRYTILDAPGHKNYVPNMIGGAAQADVGCLVISARKGEFETGFERGGQTREHAQLAKTLGVSKLVVVINKMDDPSIVTGSGQWSKERYDEIVTKITPFLRSCGYNPKKDLVFLPISGLYGTNIKDPVPKSTCPWYQGPTLFQVLDNTELPNREAMAAFRMPIMDRYKDMGTMVMGKSEAGVVRKGDNLTIMPNRVPVKVVAVYRDELEVGAARTGENLRLRLSGVEEDDISSGFMLCSRASPVPAVTAFEAQLQILELLEHKAIFTAGYKAVLHIHSIVEECEIIKLIAQIDPKTKTEKKATFVKSGNVVKCRIAVEKPICVETFDAVPKLGRFTLRDEGRTIAIGKIVKLPKSKTKA